MHKRKCNVLTDILYICIYKFNIICMYKFSIYINYICNFNFEKLDQMMGF